MRSIRRLVLIGCTANLILACRGTTGPGNASESQIAAAASGTNNDVCTANHGTTLQLKDCATADKCLAAQNDDSLAAALPTVAYCQFDRAAIATATLADAVAGQTPTAVQQYLSHNHFEPNNHLNQPADYYCTLADVGGALHMYLMPGDNGQVNTCDFPDGSSISDWTLYYGSGPDAPAPFQGLAKLLQSL